MPVYRVMVCGRGLWIAIDDVLQRVTFRVTRFVHAPDAARARQRALGMVRDDPRTRPAPGRPKPVLEVEDVAPADAVPAVQPGLAFSPDPE